MACRDPSHPPSREPPPDLEPELAPPRRRAVEREAVAPERGRHGARKLQLPVDSPGHRRDDRLDVPRRARRPPFPGLRAADEVEVEPLRIAVEPVRLRHLRRARQEGEAGVETRLVELVVAGERAVDDADVPLREAHHERVPDAQEPLLGARERQVAGRAGAERRDVRRRHLGNRRRVQPGRRRHVPAPRRQDAREIMALRERARHLGRAPAADADRAGVRRRQERGAVALEHRVRVGPRHVLRLRREHDLGLVAGERMVGVAEVQERDVPELLQHTAVARREALGADEDRLVHAEAAHRGDEQEKPPQVVGVAGGADGVARGHAFIEVSESLPIATCASC